MAGQLRRSMHQVMVNSSFGRAQSPGGLRHFVPMRYWNTELEDANKMWRRLVSLILRETAGDGPAAPWSVPVTVQPVSLARANPNRLRLQSYLASLALVALITILGFSIGPIVGPPNLVILYTLSIVFTAMRWGRQAAILSAVSSALLFDYFFVTPYRTFVVPDLWYLIMVIGFLAVALTVSVMAVNAREEAREARKREASTAALYSLTKSLGAASDLDQILDTIERHFLETFQWPMLILLPGPEGLTIRSRSKELILDDGDSAAAASVFESGLEAGSGTGQFSRLATHYVPLKTAEGIVGVLGFRTADSKEPLPPEQRQLLDTFANQAALAITRARLAQEAHRAEVLQQTDKFQKALLNTISHNLRTPLATIIGALGVVLQDGALLDAATNRKLLETARTGAGRLNRLVQNLLDMTRLEGGAARPRMEPCDVNDVIGAAL